MCRFSWKTTSSLCRPQWLGTSHLGILQWEPMLYQWTELSDSIHQGKKYLLQLLLKRFSKVIFSCGAATSFISYSGPNQKSPCTPVLLISPRLSDLQLFQAVLFNPCLHLLLVYKSIMRKFSLGKAPETGPLFQRAACGKAANQREKCHENH